EVEQALKGMLKPIYEERDTGEAEIRALFKSSAIGTIAGCMVTEGKVKRNGKVRIVRDGNVIVSDAKIESLRHEKDDANEINAGTSAVWFCPTQTSRLATSSRRTKKSKFHVPNPGMSYTS